MSLLLLHGLGGNEPEHWQNWLAEQAAACGFDVVSPDLPNADAPLLGEWLTVLEEALAGLDPDALLVAAHSAACHLWAHHVAGHPDTRAERVLLVAPPGAAELATAAPALPATDLSAGPLLAACPDTVLLLGDGDPWRADEAEYAATGLPTRHVRGGAHLNVLAGFGPWPQALAWALGGDAPGEPIGS